MITDNTLEAIKALADIPQFAELLKDGDSDEGSLEAKQRVATAKARLRLIELSGV